MTRTYIFYFQKKIDFKNWTTAKIHSFLHSNQTFKNYSDRILILSKEITDPKFYIKMKIHGIRLFRVNMIRSKIYLKTLKDKIQK